MRRFGRWVFNGLTALSLVLCVATVALWGLSYVHGNISGIPGVRYVRVRPSGFRGVAVSRGFVEFGVGVFEPRVRGATEKRDARDILIWRPGYGIGWDHYETNAWISEFGPIPHWIEHRGLIISLAWPLMLGVLLGMPFVISVVLRFLRRLLRRRVPGVCTQCGYDLRATPDRCPECGTVVKKI